MELLFHNSLTPLAFFFQEISMKLPESTFILLKYPWKFYYNFEKSFKLGENEDSFCYLIRANNKSEWIWKIFFKYILAGFAISTVTVCTGSMIICYLAKGHFDSKSVYHVLKIMWVRNQRIVQINFVWSEIWKWYIKKN